MNDDRWQSIYDSLEVEEQDDDVHVLKRESETIAQVGWSEERAEGQPELGGHWIFSAVHSEADEEWTDIRRENRDEAIDRAKGRVTDHIVSTQE